MFQLFPGRRETEHLDGVVLRFFCAWDNTAVTFGEVGAWLAGAAGRAWQSLLVVECTQAGRQAGRQVRSRVACSQPVWL